MGNGSLVPRRPLREKKVKGLEISLCQFASLIRLECKPLEFAKQRSHVILSHPFHSHNKLVLPTYHQVPHLTKNDRSFLSIFLAIVKIVVFFGDKHVL